MFLRPRFALYVEASRRVMQHLQFAADVLEPAGIELRPRDRWLVARTQQLVAEATEGYEATLSVNVIRAFEQFVDDVSNWYIRRSRRRFYDFDEAATRAAFAGRNWRGVSANPLRSSFSRASLPS